MNKNEKEYLLLNNEKQYLQIISAFEFPKSKWNYERKVFTLISNKCSLFGDSDSKKDIFRERYNLIFQRIKRSSLFSNSREPYNLTPIDALIGSPGTKFILGMLTQLKEGIYYLEDLKSFVPIKIENTLFSAGLFVEGCFVLAEGIYNNSEGIFEVSVMGLPPSENRKTTKLYLGNLDLFAPKKLKNITSKYSRFQIEEQSIINVDIPKESKFIILSDVHLDKPKVMENLKILFAEYDEQPPILFILIGNFITASASYSENLFTLKNCLEKFTNILLSFSNLIQFSHFIFIPGPNDPAGNVINILPLPPLPKIVTNYIEERIPLVYFMTNPCRIRYYGHDLILFREDLVNKMRRHCIRNPEPQQDIKELTQHLVKTLLDESHLCPLPLNIRPIYWNFDHTLYLYPLPDTIILADKYDQYEHIYDDCLCFNPGSFSIDYSFVMYKPYEKKVEFSRIEE